MIHCAYPWALLLLIPLLIAWTVWARHGHGRWWRLLLLGIFLLALSGPHIRQGRGGSDVVLILDRSQSMAAHYEDQKRILNLIAEQRQENDRLAVIVAGAGADILQGPQHQGLARLEDVSIADYASDLRSALEQAGSLIPQQRSGRIFIHSDGAYTNRNPAVLAPQFAARAVPVDVMLTQQNADADAAVTHVELPMQIRLGESFIGAAQFWSDRQEQRSYQIIRNEQVIASGDIALHKDTEVTVSFADRPPQAGIVRYRVHLDDSDDRRPGNNTARAALRIDGGERILLMSGDGSPGNVHRALSAAGLHVDSIAESNLTIDQLSAYRVLVLDQVPAHAIGHDGMDHINTWVSKLGGGFIMLGGQRSFGAGGYHRSAIEDILPVTMELRDEHRKLSAALAITLDRSGSMAASVGNGLTKMDLANHGTIAAIELLGPMDAVAVHAVDSQPHIIVPMTSLREQDAIIEKVRHIGSMGGGIYVYNALLAAGKELLNNERQSARHLILFADAADAEQPADYKQLLADYRKAGISVSVIGLGKDNDRDADFLRDVAKRGGGRIHFTEVPRDIPRLFAQETVLVARSAYIREQTPLQAHNSLSLLIGNADVFKQDWPHTNGYNLTYMRPEAQQYAVCAGDPRAPGIAAWHIGNGRSIAMPLPFDDPSNQTLLQWPGYAPLIASLVRWCAAQKADELGLLRAQRHGNSLVLDLELDPQLRERWPNVLPPVELISANRVTMDQQLDLVQIDDGRYQAHMQIKREHLFIPSLTIDQEALLGPAICLPYSPEEEPQLDDRSVDLKRLSERSGGSLRHEIIDVFDNPPSPGATIDLSIYMVALGVLLLLLEIAVRRLQLRLRRQAVQTVRESTAAVATDVAETAQSDTIDSAATPSDQGLEKDQGLHEALRQLRKRR